MHMLGCIADDFTGATDVGAALVSAGYRTTVVVDGTVPAVGTGEIGTGEVGTAGGGTGEIDAVVIALKTRTAPVADAVDASLSALESLIAAGCDRFYLKYCSTFDSTPTGNIGPVTDAVLRRLGLDIALMVPTFPANGRTVYQGHLFVGNVLLSESSMRDHPLTPMTDSNLVRVLEPQTANPVRAIGLATVRSSLDALTAAMVAEPGLVIVDALDDDDLTRIVAAAPAEILLTGGAGLAARFDRGPAGGSASAIDPTPGRRLIVSGSASEQTRAQVTAALAAVPSVKLDLAALAASPVSVVTELLAWAEARWAENEDRPVLVYATGSADDLDAADGDRTAIAERIEDALATIVDEGVRVGVRQVIVAGGETSGSVTSRLGITTLSVGPEIAPGVVWASAETARGERISVALKSGNFGDVDMFTTAWEKL